MAVLLIGSTGNGKSTLGNFLLDPSEDHAFSKQTFTTATSNLPQTMAVEDGEAPVEILGKDSFTLKVIDTPGLNESAESDLDHMICVIKELEKVKKIQACLLVVKFDSKLDTQFKTTIQYYSRLLPSLFDKNVIIAVTMFKTSKRDIRERQRKNIDVEAIKQNIIRETKKSGRLDFSPKMFMFDCLPFDGEDEEIERNLEERTSLLQFMFDKHAAVRVTDLRVAKTDSVMQFDQKQIKKLEGEISGYNERLKDVTSDPELKIALQRIEDKEGQVQVLSSQCKELEIEIDVKDSEDTVVVNAWSAEEDWMFKKAIRTFKLTSAYRIHEAVKWDNGKCIWKEYNATEYLVHGEIETKRMRGLHASVTLFVQKKDRYAKDIADLKMTLQDLKWKRKEIRDEITIIRETNERNKDTIAALEEQIKSKGDEITLLAGKYMSLSEAKDRLREMRGD